MPGNGIGPPDGLAGDPTRNDRLAARSVQTLTRCPVCGYRMDPFLAAQGWPAHPLCEFPPPAPSPMLARLAARSHYEDGPLATPCRVWDGGRSNSPGGYGVISVGGRQMRVHRLAWVARHGEIPPQTPYVLHRCDNRPCWADGHLFLGTHADNMADMLAKGRGPGQQVTRCPQGHPYTAANTYYERCEGCGPRGRRRHRRTCKRAVTRAARRRVS